MIGAMKHDVAVDNRIRIPRSVLPREVAEALEAAFTYTNPDAAKARTFGFYGRGVPATLSTWSFDPASDVLAFPRGGLARVRALLVEHGIDVRFVDARSLGATAVKIPPHRVDLWPFQKRLVEVAVSTQNCLWRSPQGSGKTTAAIAFASLVSLPTLVIVATGNLMEQWIRRVAIELGVSEREVGVVRGPHATVGRCGVTVGMQQTLRKHAAQLRGRFGVVVADEVQLFAATTFQSVIDELDAKYRLGVSGDERRADRKEFLIYDQFGGVAAEVTNDELVDGGIIHEVEVRVVRTRFRADWYPGLPPKRKVRAFDRLLKEIGSDEARNAIILTIVQSEVAEGRPVVALTHRREHCHTLDSLAAGAGLRPGLLIGGVDYAEEFERTRSRFMAGDTLVAVGTYQAVGVGFDVPAASCGILASPVANGSRGAMQFRQFRGRFARTTAGKAGAVLYYLWDESVFGLSPVRNLARWSKNVVVRDAGEWVAAQRYLRTRSSGWIGDHDATKNGSDEDHAGSGDPDGTGGS